MGQWVVEGPVVGIACQQKITVVTREERTVVQTNLCSNIEK